MVSTATNTDQFYVSGDTINLVWNRHVILPQPLTQNAVVAVNIDLVQLDNKTGDTHVIATLANALANFDEFDVRIPQVEGVSLAVLQVSIVAIYPLQQTISNHLRQVYDHVLGRVKLWSEVLYISGSNSLLNQCERWCNEQPEQIGQEILRRLPSCPPNIQQARVDSRFEEEDLSTSYQKTFHPETSSCFHQAIFAR